MTKAKPESKHQAIANVKKELAARLGHPYKYIGGCSRPEGFYLRVDAVDDIPAALAAVPEAKPSEYLSRSIDVFIPR